MNGNTQKRLDNIEKAFNVIRRERGNGLTCSEVARRIGIQHKAVRSYLDELLKQGRIEEQAIACNRKLYRLKMDKSK